MYKNMNEFEFMYILVLTKFILFFNSRHLSPCICTLECLERERRVEDDDDSIEAD